MKIVASPEARSLIRERGGLLFVWIARHGRLRGGLSTVETSTEPPAGALDYQRLEAGNILVFLHPRMRKPRELWLEVTGRRHRRIAALWDGCAFVV